MSPDIFLHKYAYQFQVYTKSILFPNFLTNNSSYLNNMFDYQFDFLPDQISNIIRMLVNFIFWKNNQFFFFYILFPNTIICLYISFLQNQSDHFFNIIFPSTFTLFFVSKFILFTNSEGSGRNLYRWTPI